jgi:hypothetical protein
VDFFNVQHSRQLLGTHLALSKAFEIIKNEGDDEYSLFIERPQAFLHEHKNVTGDRADYEIKCGSQLMPGYACACAN